MAGHVISVCIFCFICATHSPCASHAAVTHEHQQDHRYHAPYDPSFVQNATKEKLKAENQQLLPSPDLNNNNNTNRTFLRLNENVHNLTKTGSDNNDRNVNDKDFFLREIFLKYGDGKTISSDGLDRLLNHLFELQVLSGRLNSSNKSEESNGANPNTGNTFPKEHFHSSNSFCTMNKSLKSLLQTSNTSREINREAIEAACPAILFSLISGNCSQEKHDSLVESGDLGEEESSRYHVWLFSILAVFLISVCGGFAVIIIPVMQKKFYKPLLQFLVALAVGTLAGDALLHLLPHAMSVTAEGEDQEYGRGHHGHNHDHAHTENMWKGFVAMLGLILFFVMERFIPIAYKWGKGIQNKGHSHVKVLNSELEINKESDAQCMDRYNPYPRCYKDILNDPNTTYLETDENSTGRLDDLLSKKNKSINKQKCSPNSTLETGEANGHTYGIYDNEQGAIPSLNENLETNQNMTECPNDLNSSNCTEVNRMLPPHDIANMRTKDPDYTVILREHGAVHHGHSHTHGHVHAAPQNLSSVAWMVIMGDGLHNFTDGLAIGAAFSNSLAGGFSTTVAVFCHELPHELGDFAMLLKAGMSMKQALLYNILSSILCLFGNLLGIYIGDTEYASSWVFAVAAGTFIYIALVDMLPELSSAHEDEGNLLQCILHLGGLLLGFGIMTLIALYEHDLKNIFTNN